MRREARAERDYDGEVGTRGTWDYPEGDLAVARLRMT